jgi:hypothetical protein
MDVNGSPEFALTWKDWDMPAGEPICALRASERRTGDKGCSGWPTPDCSDSNTRPNGKGGAMMMDVAMLCGRPTPQAHDSQEQGKGRELTEAGRIKTHTGSDVSANLPMVAGWATPRAEDAESAGMRHSRGVADTLTAQAGQAATSSPAGTGKRGVLRPGHSRWLMGYPAAWDSCGATAMQSCRKSRLSS